MNAFGGITLFDYLTEAEIKKTVYTKIEKILMEPENTDLSAKTIRSN